MKENEVLGLLIISNSSWTLKPNNKRLPQKILVLATLFLVTISGIMLLNGASINMINKINQAQAQGQTQEQQQVGQAKFNKIWETPADLKNPESVVYAPKQNLLFVSNINGKPDQKDQNGFISTVSPSRYR